MKKMIKATAVLDVGGTFVKHALFLDGQFQPDSSQTTAIDEAADANAIVNVLAACARHADCVSACMPGPMDYANGKSLMKHKFQALYGIELKTVLEEKTGIPWNFVHDVVAFLAGTISLGESGDALSPAAVTLGTGLGYAYAKGTVIQKNEMGSPTHPLWNQPYREGIVEDFASARGLVKQYEKQTGQYLTALEISQHARAGEADALTAFAKMGYILGAALEKRVLEEGIDLIILGGQVSRSADLFLPHMQSKLSIPVHITAYLNEAALYGAFALLSRK